MVSLSSKSRFFEEHRVPADDDFLHALLMLPKPPIHPKRLVFIPPLIGAGASQPLIIFRNLTRRGAVLMSFEYRGHPYSTGVFELDTTIADTRHALVWASHYARSHGLPLHGFATCYGMIALAAQFGGDAPGHRLWSMNSVSGLFRLNQILRFEDFAPAFSRRLGRDLSAASLLDGVAGGEFDVDGPAFRQALQEYLRWLFPELNVGEDRFEELRYDRADIPRTLLQLSRARYLDAIHVPARIPCNVFMGRKDCLLSLDSPDGRAAYRQDVLALIPHAEIFDFEFDHYGRGPDHDRVIDKLADLFEECESRAVPLHAENTVTEVQDIHE